MDNFSLYDTTNEFYEESLKAKILARRCIFFERIEVYANPQILTIYGGSIGNPITLTYISNKFNTITKESILKACGISETEVYIGYDKFYFDMNSELNLDNIIIANGVKTLFDQFKQEYDEFFEFINWDLCGYLDEHPEEKYL